MSSSASSGETKSSRCSSAAPRGPLSDSQPPWCRRMASRHVLRPALLLPVIFAAVLGTASAQTRADPAPHQATLRVATGRQAPFVIEENGSLSGFSIDLWQEIARRLGRDFVWVNVRTSNQQLAAVAGGQAD